MVAVVPVVFKWIEIQGEAGELLEVMVPIAKYRKVAHRQFHTGEEYPLVILEPRSRASHNQYFKAVSDGFQNLPENLDGIAERLNLKMPLPADGFEDADHLRKWALCETGWCDVGEFDFDSPTEATRLAKFYRSNDSYAQIAVRNKTHVTIKTAKSQSAAAMAKQPFEDSKRDVLNLIEAMVGLKKGSLMKNAGRSG